MSRGLARFASAMPAPLRSRLAPALIGLGLLAPVLAPAVEIPGEYFFNVDPGIGAATPLTLPLADPVEPLDPSALTASGSRALSLPLPAEPAGGAALLGLRFRDSDGAWGPTQLHRLHLLSDTSGATLSLAWGSADPVAATPADDGTLTVTRPASAPGDADRLVIRPRVGASFDGPAFTFRVQPLGGALPARLYYALDRSPAPASSPFLELSGTQRLAASELTLDPGPAAPGFHTLHLQLHDSHGARTEQIRPLHVTPSGVHTLAGLAYTFQPVGDRAPSVIEIAPLRVSPELQDVLLLPPPGLPAGAYTLVVQLADFSGELGAATNGDLFVGGAYDRWATAALEGRPAAETGPLADPDNDQIVNLLEYAFGHDPLQRNASASYSIRTESTSSAAPFFVVEYRQREGGAGEPGVDYTAGGLRYTVEASTDLQTWIPFSEVPGIGHHGSSRTNSDGTETVLLEIFYGDALDSAQRLFLRLKVSAVP